VRPSLFVAAAAFAFAGVCARPEPRTDHSPPSTAPARALPEAAARVPAATSVLPAASIYDLSVRLLDDRGAAAQLDEFRGHPVLITMFYGSCQAACPLITADLKRIEQRLPPASRANLRVLMVSFDARRDTPLALSRMKKERGMDPERWTLASASDDEARELAGVLGIHFRKLDNGQFYHSSSILLLDEEGRPRARVDGLGHDPAELVVALAASST
jgi:protein SCO1/2